nr:hypothetical protein L204_00548 [Cryptococcus depauperatus CBS 7855]
MADGCVSWKHGPATPHPVAAPDFSTASALLAITNAVTLKRATNPFQATQRLPLCTTGRMMTSFSGSLLWIGEAITQGIHHSRACGNMSTSPVVALATNIALSAATYEQNTCLD